MTTGSVCGWRRRTARRQVVVSSDTVYITHRHTHRCSNLPQKWCKTDKETENAQVMSPRQLFCTLRNAPKIGSSLSLSSLFCFTFLKSTGSLRPRYCSQVMKRFTVCMHMFDYICFGSSKLVLFIVHWSHCAPDCTRENREDRRRDRAQLVWKRKWDEGKHFERRKRWGERERDADRTRNDRGGKNV